MDEPRFYVYEHVRLDTGQVFYVGKGSGNRYRTARGGGRRSAHWWRVARKAGWEPRIVFRCNEEELAFLAEVELIAKHRRIGSPLTNTTDGGEGVSGHRHSDETRRILREKAYVTRGDDNPSRRPEVRKLISERQREMGDRHPTKRPETRRRMSEAAKRRRATPNTRAAISAANTGEGNPFYGCRHSQESLEKMSRNGVAGIRVTCQRCGKSGGKTVMHRWHFGNCRATA